MFRLSFDILKKLRFGKAASTALASVALASVCACSDSNIIDAPEVNPDNVSVSISFTLAMNNAQSTRVVDTDETTPGTDRENAINSAVIVVEDVATGLRTPIEMGSLREGVNTVTVKDVPVGAKKIYAGVNLSPEQIEAFCDNNKAYEIPTSFNNRNFDMVEAYAPGFANAERNDIAMFSENYIECTFEAGKTRYDLTQQSINLKRLVAKILVTCKAENNAEDAKVVFKEGSALEQDGGWMYRGDVHFIVNGINRKSYIMQKPNGEYYEDPNYSIANNIGTSNGMTVPQNTEDFYYNDDPKYYDIKDAYMQTPFYEEAKIPTTAKGGKGVYTEGIYAPENTFSLTDLSESQANRLATYTKAWPMITHVTITAKYTPKHIYAEESLNEYIQSDEAIGSNDRDKIKELFAKAPTDPENPSIKVLTVSDEKYAQTLLDYSLKKAGYSVTDPKPSTSGLPNETYYAKVEDNKWRFYTYGAAKIASGIGESGANRMELGKGFAPFVGGRGYYSAYIDNRKGVNVDKPYKKYSYGSVERNVYYILTIDNFSTPGSSNTESEVIEVHTQSIDWEMGGEGHIILP